MGASVAEVFEVNEGYGKTQSITFAR